jgi:acyl-CoA synthetase (NDP forming)
LIETDEEIPDMTSTVPAVGELRGPSVIDALLRPRSVAMIGASRNPKALGGRPIGYMASYGFPGQLYVVNGSAPEVQGLPAYASISEVPGPVDLALVMVRAELVAGVLRDCAAAGVRVAVVVSSGFGEGMGEGAGILEALAPELAAAGMRVLGPNCEGLASLPANAPMTFSPVLDVEGSGTRLRAGNIAVLSQSGGLGFAVAQWGTEAGLDFSYIISTGNEFDLDSLELAGHLADSPDTDIVIMLIESFRDLDEFTAVCERFRAAGKRLVVAKLGKTEPGARGAYAHTRHVAGDAALYARLFQAYGVLEAADSEELIDVTQAVAKVRRLGARELPPGGRVAIVTTSGGAGVWLADACASRGLTVPVLSAPLQEALKPHMPAFGSPVNPVDLTAQLTAGGTVVPALEAIRASGEVDAIVLVTSLSSAGRLERDRDDLAALVARSEIPFFVFSYTRPAPSCVQILQELGVPWYTSAARAARGLAALTAAGRPSGNQTTSEVIA